VKLEEAVELPRVAIAGVPHSGKTTLAVLHAGRRPLVHTDDSIDREGWSERSSSLVRELGGLDSFVVEGMRVPHALRKGLEVDAVIWLPRSWDKLEPGQESMGKGALTVFNEWRRADRGRTPVVIVRSDEGES
jgi:hypothetical protein